MKESKNEMISQVLKDNGIKKLLIAVGIIIAVVVLLRFIIGFALLGKLFGFASDHLQHFEKEKTRIEKGLDKAQKSMSKAQEDIWTAVEKTHITQDLAEKTEQIELERQLEKYRENNRLEVYTALEHLRKDSAGGKEVLELISIHTGGIFAGIQYKIDKAIALKKQIPELKTELTALEQLTQIGEHEQRRKNAIINYLNDIKPEDLNEEMDYWLAKSRAEKSGCSDYYKCKDNALSAEYLKILIPALEDYINAGHFVYGEFKDGFYNSHKRSTKEILNSARQAAGMPYEVMTKEEKELALQAELDTLKKMKEDLEQRELEEVASKRLGNHAKR